MYIYIYIYKIFNSNISIFQILFIKILFMRISFISSSEFSLSESEEISNNIIDEILRNLLFFNNVFTFFCKHLRIIFACSKNGID